MAEVDWVVVPSIWWENAPLVIQEAFRHRRPVICGDIGGMAEMVRDGVDGLHAPVERPRRPGAGDAPGGRDRGALGHTGRRASARRRRSRRPPGATSPSIGTPWAHAPRDAPAARETLTMLIQTPDAAAPGPSRAAEEEPATPTSAAPPISAG